MSKNWSITMLEYTMIEEFPNAWLYAGQYVYEGASPITYTICLLKKGDDLVLIDTGYDMEKPDARDFAIAQKHLKYQSPVKVLKKAGVDPADIKHVILTHAHWDHMGGLNFFPNAKFYIQKEEILKWVETMALPHEYGVIKHPILKGDMEDCIRLMSEDRVVLLDGAVDDLLEGIDIRVARYGHSWASNVVLIHTEKGIFANCGDVAYVRKNITGGEDDGAALPNGFGVGGAYDTIRAIQDIKGWVGGDVDKILLAHEMGVFDLYESEITDDDLHIAYVVR